METRGESMKEYNNKRDIELRLEEIDRMESHIAFSADSSTNENKRRLSELDCERRRLKIKLEELEVN